MKILSQNAEAMLRIFINKYEKTRDYMIGGDTDEFPRHFVFNMKNIMQEIENSGYITINSIDIIGGWWITLTPEAIEYFEKKGCRVELFEELMESEKNLLKELIRIDNENGNLTEYINKKLEDDVKDKFRGIVGILRSNGLITLMWADNNAYNINLTQAGRTYFEREKKYNDKLLKSTSSTYNIGTITTSNSHFVIGNILDSVINISNSISSIEQEIDEKCVDDFEKEELKLLLEEAKEIIENIKESRHIEKRKSFFQKLSTHLEKHGWFYGEIIGLLGQTTLMLLNGQ